LGIGEFLRWSGAAMLLVLAAFPARAEILTLKEALGIAYQTNPQLAGEQAQLRATDENVAQANAGWRPTVNASGTFGITTSHTVPPPFLQDIDTLTHSQTAGVTVSQPLFRGGRTFAEVGRAKAQVRQERARLIAVEQSVLLNAVNAYMNVVRDSATYQLQVSNVAALQKQLDAARTEFKFGEVTKTDVAQAEARLAGAQASLLTAQGQLYASRAAFTQIIGRRPELLQEYPPFPDLPATQNDAMFAALKLNPNILAAHENEQAAKFAVDDAEGALAPQVSLQGQYQYSKTKANKNDMNAHAATIVGQVTVPIYQGGAEWALIKQQKELHGQSQMQIFDAERQVRQAVETAWQAYQAAQAAIRANLAQVKADQLAYEGVQKERKAGTRTVLDVLNAEQELLNAEVAVVVSRHDAYVAAHQVLAAAGLLTAKALGLKVKLYDPTEHYNDANDQFGFGD
jgi:TolC family type I secretion outer membrane protein